MRLSLRQLSVFRALMQSTTATEAAERLHMTQPGVSKVLRQIESDLGVVLFERIRGRLYATPEAVSLYPEIEKIFGAVSAFERMVDDIRDAESGHLSIAALSTTADVFLPETIRAFRDALPNVRISVQVLTSHAIADQVTEGHVDIGLLGDSIEVSGVAWEDLLDEHSAISECVCIMPPGHPLGGHERIRLTDVLRFPIVSYFVSSPLGGRLKRLFEQNGLDYDVAIEAGSSHAICALVESGAGVAIVEPYVLHTERGPDLVGRPIDPALRVRPRLLYPQYRPLSAVARRFVSMYKALIEERAARYDASRS